MGIRGLVYGIAEFLFFGLNWPNSRKWRLCAIRYDLFRPVWNRPVKLKWTTVTRVSSEKRPKSNFHAGKLLSNSAKNKRGPLFFFFFFFSFLFSPVPLPGQVVSWPRYRCPSNENRWISRSGSGQGVCVLRVQVTQCRKVEWTSRCNSRRRKLTERG